MSVVLCTLALNEAEHLDRLWRQHRDWPGMTAWVFVEAADRTYAATSPHMVTADGLSTDGTTEFLDDLAASDPRVIHVRHGFTSHPDPAQGKCPARQRYLDAADAFRPDFLAVLDADEFYTRAHQAEIMRLLAGAPASARSFRFRQRDVWRPPGVADRPLFALEARGGYWSVRHTRFWRWQPGLRYRRNHNWPEDPAGRPLSLDAVLYDRVPGTPECVHLGFASRKAGRAAKHAYYRARGEGAGADRRRKMYVDCRAAWETWRPGARLPHGARVVPYAGPVPECFL